MHSIGGAKIYGQLQERPTSAIKSVVYMCNWRGDIFPKYMCILLKLIQCSGILWSIGGGGSWYICDLFGVAVLYTSMVNWRRVHLP